MGPHTHTYIYYTQFGYNFTLKKKRKNDERVKKENYESSLLSTKNMCNDILQLIIFLFKILL